MAFRVASASSNSTASTPLLTAAAGDLEVWIEILPGSSYPMDIGPNSSVAEGSGFRLVPGGPRLHLRVRPGDALWCRGSDPSNSSIVQFLVRSAA